jgi:hypothetical protein
LKKQVWLQRTIHNPEINLLLVSFLFNFVWEMWQMPYYVGFNSLDHMSVVRTCTQASLGDGVISVLAFWSGAAIARSRGWIYTLPISSTVTYLASGVVITIFMEWLATEVWDRWEYASIMPELPILGTGMLPMLQWLILPPLILWVARQQTLTSQSKAICS